MSRVSAIMMYVKATKKHVSESGDRPLYSYLKKKKDLTPNMTLEELFSEYAYSMMREEANIGDILDDIEHFVKTLENVD